MAGSENSESAEKEAVRFTAPTLRSLDNPQALSLNISREFNIAVHLMNLALKRDSEHIAVVDGEQIITFKQLNTLSNKAGNFLRKHGVHIEQRVIFMLKSGLDYIALFLGAIKIGAVPVTIPPNLQRHELRYLLDESRGAVAVVNTRDFLTVSEICQELPWHTDIIPDSPMTEANVLSFPEESKEADDTLVPAPTNTDDIAFWAYTQGVVSFHKAAMHMQRAPLYSCMSYAQGVLNLDENDIILSTSPFYTSQGLMERIFFPIYSGASVIMAPQEASGLDLLNILRTHKVTVLFSTPDVYNNILKEAAEKHEATSLPSLRACVSTAQTLPLSTQLNWKKSFDIDILNALSSTEELYAFITNRPGHSRAGSVGQAAPGYAIRLEDKDGFQVPPGQVGNLLVYGGSTMAGFWNKRKKSTHVLLGPWLDTGDKCMVDEDGYYYFAGKRDDMIFIDDHWIAPSEVEQNLLSLPEVAQAAVLGATDSHDRVHLRAYIVLKPNLEPSNDMANSLRIKANANQPTHMQIKWFDFVPNLPRSSNGRLQRYKLR